MKSDQGSSQGGGTIPSSPQEATRDAVSPELEKVAKAIHSTTGSLWPVQHGCPECHRAARAALMAIREPSNSTVEALMFETPPEIHAPSACRTVRAVIAGYINHILGER